MQLQLHKISNPVSVNRAGEIYLLHGVNVATALIITLKYGDQLFSLFLDTFHCTCA